MYLCHPRASVEKRAIKQRFLQAISYSEYTHATIEREREREREKELFSGAEAIDRRCQEHERLFASARLRSRGRVKLDKGSVDALFSMHVYIHIQQEGQRLLQFAQLLIYTALVH